jgi:hypothetical protein
VDSGLGFIFDKKNVGFVGAMLKALQGAFLGETHITMRFSGSDAHLATDKISAPADAAKVYITPAMVVRFPCLVFVPIVLAQARRPFYCIELRGSLAWGGAEYKWKMWDVITLYRTHAPADLLGIKNV